MKMAPKSPWGKKPPQNALPTASLPKTQPDTPAKGIAKLDYEEIQNDELLALSSIYGDDFRRIETNQGVWKKAEPSFEIRIRSSDDDISIILAVVFTATYPRSPPLLTIKGDKDLREGTRFKIQKAIETKPKELVSSEQAMVMEIVNACLDILEDAAQAKADGLELPSLEEERAAHEEAANKLAKEQEQAEKWKQQMNSMEEERMLGSLVEDEMKRQKTKENETKRKSRLPGRFVPKASIENGTFKSQDEILAFDHPISYVDSRGDPCTFQVITSKVCIRRGLVSNCFTVRPVVYQVDAPTIALKQAELHSEAKDQNLFKKQLQALETDLRSLKELRHRNVLEFLDFKVQKTTNSDSSPGSSWTVSTLTEFAEKGSLEEFLDVAGSLGVAKVRSWTIELLDALRFLHENGIVHEDIHTGNILLVREFNGEIKPKLADANFQRKLHDLKGGPQSKDTLSVAKSAYWLPPETANTKQFVYTQKTDVWYFGIVFLQMAFGLSVIKKYSSPSSLASSLSLTDSFSEFIGKLFKADPKKRARAFELGSSEFLATDAEFLDIEASSPSLSRLGSVSSLQLLTPRRPRHDSMNAYSGSLSRYKQDFVEEGRLGKGGFGEVVKARKKLDGQIYAIKKIAQKSTESLTEVLKEVRLLSQLSHPSVVRYYNTWTEEVFEPSYVEDNTTSTDAATTEQSVSVRPPGDDLEIEFGNSTGGLDFMSSRGYPQIEFGFDDGSDEDTEDDDNDDSTSAGGNNDHIQGKNGNGLALKKTRSGSQYRRPFKIILYISMEYCDKHTLRDLIRRGLYRDDNEMWRLLRQILEGLVHIHGLNVVHRDLKPENIFIDSTSSVKIGDFGLATSGQYSVVEGSLSTTTSAMNGEMTKSIGTAFYVAPEVSSSTGGGSYTSKVDMYSLGVILFEMCYKPLLPGMEKAKTSESLRLEPPTLPSDFDSAGKVDQASIIYSLLARNPRDRPSSSELLQSGKLPMQMESEIIRRALAGLSDSESPYYQKMMTTLFSTPNKPAKDFAWDMDTSNPTSGDILLQGLVKQNLVNIFRHHGAIETQRSVLFPRSRHYGSNAVQVLDPNGTLLQLPFDLTLPHARSLAKHEPPVLRSFAFGSVYRSKPSGAQPMTVEEVDFDIVSSDALDLGLKEAEVIKVLDEIVISIPTLDSSYMCFHINHSDLLALIFDHCRIETAIREAVTETLSKLNIGPYSWQKIKTELRSQLIGASATSVDDLQKFDFRDTPNKAFQKLKTLLEGTNTFHKASSVVTHLREVVDYTKRFQVRSKIYVSPLCSIKERFCKGGLVFSCLYGKKVKDVLAAGGRYDSLIKEHRHRIGTSFQQRHAVGFNLGLERLVKHPKSGHKGSKKLDDDSNGIWNTKRCDVLVASHDPTILRTGGIDVVQSLWNNDISAELAQDCRSPEDLLSKYRDEQHSWIITIRQDSILYKVKSMDRKDAGDTDVPTTQLVPWLKNEIRDRDNKETNNNPRGKLLRHASQPEGPSGSEHEQEVRVLIAGTKSKKSNRRNIVEQAQTKASSLVHTFLDGPIAAIETTDQVLELIRETKLSDPDSWRKLTHAVPMADRKYIGELHDLIEEMAKHNKNNARNAFVYNFRTGTCIYYDLEA
ncbi:anticodon binding domain of tRNAs-domain-containing protein [Amylocarpus encephaloides]|uniref:non-specific serine/threonine protein kinase n=1 Tax=Amylocarpus encephaloides TaxID=45428 RepID=A0A9P8C7U2_9HELO|nr:anticodon binding domain of tRNAs-domain-containing protein [Amylocarpus encephaloides]